MQRICYNLILKHPTQLSQKSATACGNYYKLLPAIPSLKRHRRRVTICLELRFP